MFFGSRIFFHFELGVRASTVGRYKAEAAQVAIGITAGLVLTFLLPLATSPAHAKNWDQLSQVSVIQADIVLGKSQVVETPQPFSTALVADPEVADILPLTDHSIYVVGKKIGATRLVIFDADKRVQSVVELAVTPDIEALQRSLLANVQSAITIRTVNGTILLDGVVADSVELDRALAIAERFAPGGVTNSLTVDASQQVMLEVRFVEATRVAARELGIGSRVRGKNVNADIGPQSFVQAAGPLVTSALLSGAQPFGTLIARLLDSGTDVDLLIRALEERSVVRRLAEPNLLTVSGDTASFLAGGEFPFPVSADQDRIAIEFKQFGVALAFTPTVLAGGRINLKIIPEVSEIDASTTVQVSDITIPGLIVRRADTTVELNDGQSFAIAGLLQHTNLKRQSQLPWLGQVPILGALFRSAEYQKQETDLVIIVTPRLVKPKVPGQVLATPLDRKKSGNDVDFFVAGRAEVPTEADAHRARGPVYGHNIHLSSGSWDVATSK